jgi:two-component system NtrC family response regulator
MIERHKEVVVVDDDSDILSVISDVLREEGYKPVLFRDGAHAEAHLSRHRPQLVMTDLRLPVVSGRDLVLRLRRQWGPDLPIVVISGLADAAIAEGLPVQAVLPKPFDLDELSAVMDRLVLSSPPSYDPGDGDPLGGAPAW